MCANGGLVREIKHVVCSDNFYLSLAAHFTAVEW